MKKITLYLITFFSLQIFFNLHAQYGIAHCGDSVCSQKAIDSMKKGFLKKTRLDSIRCLHLYANYQYENMNNRDSAIYYLKKVHSMDDLYISKYYAIETVLKKHDNRSTDNYFFIRMNLPNEEEFLNREIIDEYVKEILSDEADYDEFISSIDELDQEHRGDWNKLDAQINEIIESCKNNNAELDLLNEKGKAVKHLQSINDSIAREIFVEKFQNDLDYFDREFSNDEKISLFAFFLHWGNNLLETNDMLQKLVDKNVLSIEQCMNVIGRCYCMRYQKSPFQSSHCDQDEALLPLVKEEFPFFYESYQAKKEND